MYSLYELCRDGIKTSEHFSHIYLHFIFLDIDHVHKLLVKYDATEMHSQQSAV